MKLSNAARQQTTIGEIVNLVRIFSRILLHSRLFENRWQSMLHVLVKLPLKCISSGQVRIYLKLIHATTIHKGPFQLIVALVLLYRQMQLAIIPGVILLLIMIPINLGLQRIQKILTVSSIQLKNISFDSNVHRRNKWL